MVNKWWIVETLMSDGDIREIMASIPLGDKSSSKMPLVSRDKLTRPWLSDSETTLEWQHHYDGFSPRGRHWQCHQCNGHQPSSGVNTCDVCSAFSNQTIHNSLQSNVMGKLEIQHLFEMMRVDILENKLALSKYLSLLINFLSLKVSLIDWNLNVCY